MKYLLTFLIISFIGNQSVLAEVSEPQTKTKIMVNAGPDLVICNGDSVQLNGTGGVNYSWSPAVGLSNPLIPNPIAKPTATINYILFSIDANNNILERDTLTITVNPKATLSLPATPSVCEGQAFTPNPTITGPITTSTWVPATYLSNPNVANPTITAFATTFYTLTISTAAGCSATDTFTVFVRPTTAFVMPDTAVCISDTLYLGAGGGTAYQWSPTTNMSASNAPNPFVYPLSNADTLYTVTITDSLGCAIVRQVRVRVDSLPFVYAGRDTAIYCRDTLPLFGVGAGVSIQWSPYQYFDNSTILNPILSPWYSMDYLLQVIDGNGCRGYDLVHVHLIDHFMDVQIAPHKDVICPGDTLQLEAITSHEVVNYAWNPPVANFSAPNQAVTLVNPPFSTLVNIFVEDSLQCKDVALSTIFIDDFVIQTIDNRDLCVGQSLQLTTNGSNTFTYNWQPPTGLSSNIVAQPFLTANQTVTYTVTAIDTFGCVTSDTVTLTVQPKPQVQVGNDAVTCLNQPVQLSGTGEGNPEWKPAIGLDNPYLFNPIASPPQTTQYFLVMTNQWGCRDSDEVKITVLPTPVLNNLGSYTICEGDTVQFSATGAEVYQWSPMEGLSAPGAANPLAFPSQTTTYQLIAANLNGCSTTGSVLVNVNPTPKVKILAPAGVCAGEADTLFALDGGDVYLWSTGQTSDNILVSPDTLTLFWCESFYAATGCGGERDSVWVNKWKMPVAEFAIENPSAPNPPNYYVGMEVQFTNQSQHADLYTWDMGVGELPLYVENPLYGYSRGGTFNVSLTATSYNGCKAQIQKPIFIEYPNLYLPTAFSPNGDTDNEVYKVKFWGIESGTVTIYDREGQKVFESESIDFEWDGKAKGQPCPEGVYVVRIDAVGENGQIYKKVASVTLFR